MAMELKRSKEIISALIDYQADVNWVGRNEITPLMCAIKNNYKVDIIHRLISEGAKINTHDCCGLTPLMYAMKINYKEIIRRLIYSRANVNEIDSEGRSCLLYAVMYTNDVEVINLLIDKGADLSKLNNHHDELLFSINLMKRSYNNSYTFKIIENCEVSRQKIFLNYLVRLNMNKKIIFDAICRGADVNAVDEDGDSPLINAVINKCDREVIIKLIESGADVNVKDKDGVPVLRYAAFSSDYKELMKILVHYGANINIQNNEGETVLMYLLRFNWGKELVSNVIELGADVNLRNNHGETPLMVAIYSLFEYFIPDLGIITLLIKNGANVNDTDNEGYCPLIHALLNKCRGNDNIFRILLDCGADLGNYLENFGNSKVPLSRAIGRNRNVEKVIEVLRYKEDIFEVDRCGNIFLEDLVKFYKYKELALTMLRDHIDVLKKDSKIINKIVSNAVDAEFMDKLINLFSIDINNVDREGKTPLMYAVIKNRGGTLINMMIEKGAHPNWSDHDLNTPLHFANSEDVIDTLIICGNADINAKNAFYETPYEYASHHYTSVQTLKAFIKHLVLISSEESIKESKEYSKYNYHINECKTNLDEMKRTNIINDLSYYRFCGKLSKHEKKLISESEALYNYNKNEIEKFCCYRSIIIMKIKMYKMNIIKRKLLKNLENLIIDSICEKENEDPYNEDRLHILNNCDDGTSHFTSEYISLGFDNLHCVSKYLSCMQIIKLFLVSVKGNTSYEITPLMCAIKNNYKINIIHRLISEGAQINTHDYHGLTPLMYAIKINDKEIISRLIYSGENVNGIDEEGRSCLFYAVMFTNVEEVINLLINKGADLNLTNNKNYRYTAKVIENYDVSCQKIFLNYLVRLNMNKKFIFDVICKGADVNAVDEHGRTPLINAIINKCDQEVIIKLIESGADVNITDKDGELPLWHAADSTDCKELLKILVRYGANINIQDKDGYTILMRILRSNRARGKEVVRNFIELGADVNLSNNHGTTPLMVSIGSLDELLIPDLEIIRMLIKHGANVNDADKEGYSPLMYALSSNESGSLKKDLKLCLGNISGMPIKNCANVNDNIFRLLLYYGADLCDALAKFGIDKDPLCLAVGENRNDVEVVIEVLRYKDDIFEVDKKGNKFLDVVLGYYKYKELLLTLFRDHIDILKKDSQMINKIVGSAMDTEFMDKLIHLFGIDINNVDKEGKTPLMYAVKNTCVSLIDTMIEKGAYPKWSDHDLNTPLHFAEEEDDINTLIIYGDADINAKNTSGLTPYEYASHHYIYPETLETYITYLLLMSLEENIKESEQYSKHNDCKMEVDEMKRTNIINDLSYYKFCGKLSKHEKKLVAESKELFDYNKYKISKFCIYHSIIIIKLNTYQRNIMKRKLLKNLENLIIESNYSSENEDPYTVNKSFVLNNCDKDETLYLTSENVSLGNDNLYCISKYLSCKNMINLFLFPAGSSVLCGNRKMCYDTLIKQIVSNDIDKVVELLVANETELKSKMTNFKSYYLFHKVTSKEMIMVLLDYFESRNIFDISNILTSIINVAIMNGMGIDMIQKLIDKGGNVKNTDMRGISPLLQSVISKRSVSFIKYIIEIGANVNEICDDYENTILHLAVDNFCEDDDDDLERIKLLIDYGANVNALNTLNEIPMAKSSSTTSDDLWFELIKRGSNITNSVHSILSIALSKKGRSLELIHKLIVLGADVNVCNIDRELPLLLALKNSYDIDIVVELLRNSTSVDYRDKNSNPLLVAMEFKRSKEIISVLIDHGAKVDLACKYTPLMSAIKNNYKVDVIHRLISAGAQINTHDYHGLTPLMYAIKINDKEIISRLIYSGANVNGIDEEGRSCLFYAVMFTNDEEVINLLINKGADLSKLNKHHDEVLFSIELIKNNKNNRYTAKVIENYDVSCQKIFLNYLVRLNMNKKFIFDVICKGADVNAVDEHGRTPLINAIINKCDQEVIIKLIESGADVNITDKDGELPLWHAADSTDCKELLKILVKYGANINTQDKDGYTILMRILRSNRARGKEVVRNFIELGADVNLSNNHGTTPLMVAIGSLDELLIPDLEIIRMLIKHGANVNDADKEGYSPLMYALSSNEPLSLEKALELYCVKISGIPINYIANVHGNIFCLLLYYGADLCDALAKFGIDKDPLCLAVGKNRNVEVVIEVLRYKDDIFEVDKKGNKFLDVVLGYYKYKELLLTLFRDRIDILKKDSQMINKIVGSAMDAEFMDKLIHLFGIDINNVDREGKTPLMYAVKNTCVSLIDTMIEKGAYPKWSDHDLNTPLHFAEEVDDINTLIIYGDADINAKNTSGLTPYEYASHHYINPFTLETYIRHLVLMSLEENIKESEQYSKHNDFLNDCKMEVDEMKRTNIIDDLSYYKFCGKLSKHEKKLVAESKELFDYDKYTVSEFIIYHSIIIMKLNTYQRNIIKRKLLKNLENLIIESNYSSGNEDPYTVNKSFVLNNRDKDETLYLTSENVSLGNDNLYCISKYLSCKNIINLFLVSL
ncbi:uncharacterized protein LOC142334030 [Lycorma delicatula]|uniref:uncharacterized protein LOC142334030 n=1 Tax=Lycorma delicatula TaxID=130591 RepID=UPI003F50FC3B